ncbi:LysR family transcriptional regulator [Pseudokineococcus basanitobsidens]|uniref:LysR family transcriptional regulator n=1 Tax=Pseudokineococcus basanitobsidens TaxID=1926649 RepID=UPI0030DB165A
MPDLRSLQLLLAVRDTGSLGAAGAACGTSQQAASVRLRATEALVGVPLVVRGARGSSLTPAGELLARWADVVVDAAVQLDAAVAALRQDAATHLRVAASLTVAEHLVPRWLAELGRRARAAGREPVQVALRTANSEDVAALVRAGEVEIGFVEGPQAPEHLSARVVATDELVVVVPPDHPWARRRRGLLPAEVAATALVSRESGSGTRSALRQAVTAALPPGAPVAEPALEVASAAAVRASVVAGVAPGALSSLDVADDLTLGRLVAVPVQGVDLRRRLRAVWREGAAPPAGPARDLLALTGEAAAAGPGHGRAAPRRSGPAVPGRRRESPSA